MKKIKIGWIYNSSDTTQLTRHEKIKNVSMDSWADNITMEEWIYNFANYDITFAQWEKYNEEKNDKEDAENYEKYYKNSEEKKQQ